MPLTPQQRETLLKQGFNPTDYEQQEPTAPEESLSPPIVKSGPSKTPPSAGGSFLRLAASDVLPAFGSGVGMALGASGAGLLGLGTGPGAIAAGIAGGAGGGYIGGKLMQGFQNALLPNSWKQQLQEDATVHPGMSFGAGLATLPVAGMSPGIGNLGKAGSGLVKLLTGNGANMAEKVALGNVATGATLNPIINAVTSKIENPNQPLKASDIVEQALIGAAFNKPNAIGRAIGIGGEHMIGKDDSYNPTPLQEYAPPLIDTSRRPTVPILPDDNTGNIIQTPTAKVSPKTIDKSLGVLPNSQTADQASETGEIVNALRERENKAAALEIVNKNEQVAKQEPAINEQPQQSTPPTPETNLNKLQQLVDDPNIPIESKVAAQELITKYYKTKASQETTTPPIEQQPPTTKLPEGTGQGAAARLSELRAKTTLTPEEITEKTNLEAKSTKANAKWSFEDLSKKMGLDKPLPSSEATAKEQPPITPTTPPVESIEPKPTTPPIESPKKPTIQRPYQGLKPSDIKLGTEEDPRFTGDKTGEQKLPYTTAPVVRSVLDSIRQKAGPMGNRIADALEQFTNKEMNNRGSFDKGMKAFKGLSKEDMDNVYKTLLAEDKSSKPLRDTLTDTKQLSLYDAWRDELLRSRAEQVAAKQPIIEYKDGVPTAREAKVNPTYFPNIPSKSVLDTLLNHPETSDAKTLKYDFIDHSIASDIRPDVSYEVKAKDAQEKLNNFLGSFGKGEVSASRFGASRVAEGVGLPNSWIEPNMNKAMESYVRRVSKDRAWHDAIETIPDVNKALGATKDPWLKDIESTQEPLNNMKDIKAALSHINGKQDAREIDANAVAKVATSAYLGPLTAIHIATTTPFGLMSFSSIRDLPALVYSYRNALSSGIEHAFKTGYAHRDVTFGHEFLDGTTRFADKMNTLSRFISKVSAREHLDYLSKGMLQAGSEFIVDKNIALAKQGNKNAIELLNRIDKKFDFNRGDVTDLEKQQLASNLASFVHGDYSIKNMPSWMLSDGFVAPFFKLASWQISQTNHFAKNIITPARKGNFTPLIMSSMGVVVGGALVKYLKEKASGKESNIPYLDEIAKIDPNKDYITNLSEHPGNVAYNLAAMASYSGYMGLVSQAAKTGFDIYYKNKPQGAMFPLDETISNAGTTVANGATALMHVDSTGEQRIKDSMDIIGKMLLDTLNENIQLSRIATTQIAKHTDLMPQKKEQLQTSQYNQQLRRFNQIQGREVQQQGLIESNPYADLNEKKFKKEEDLGKASGMLPSILQEEWNKSNGDFFTFKQKLEGLKQNPYEIMPKLESNPKQFRDYYNFISNTQGASKAQELLQQYYKRNTVNSIKSAMVPSL